MPRLLAIVMALTLAAGATAVAKQPRLSCRSGVTVFKEGKLRIFSVRFDTRDEFGWNEYACLGTRGRPLIVGGDASTTGTASGETPAYAFAGGRYLGIYQTSDGEGGPGAYFAVVDLRTRRTVAFRNAVYDEGVPQFRVAADGSLLTAAENLQRKIPGRAKPQIVTDADASELALVGATVYWTEAAGPRSAQLAGVSGSAEGRMLEPINLRRRAGGCWQTKGRTVAASPRVRVVGGGHPFACRTNGPERIELAGGDVRIIGDRWLLVRAGDGARVFDTRTGDRVIDVASGVAAATLLASGALAWIRGDGGVSAQAVGQPLPVELAPAGSGAAQLAASRRVVYWMAGGEARSARP
jgi:hypothetical protein